MPIKNRDGTIYKLRGPNPAMEVQDKWNEYVVHNMKFRGTTITDERFEEPPAEIEQNDFAAELAETKMEMELPVPPVEQPKPEQFKPEPTLPKGVERVDVHCLPALLRERKDSLYGDKYQTTQYGSPFVFEAVIFKEEDLFIKMWTNAQAVGRGSILYPK